MKRKTLLTLLVYASFAFIIWEYNPMYWHQSDRFMFVIVLIFANVIHWVQNLLYKDLKK